MATRLGKYDEDIPEGHAFAETRDVYPDDRLLRLAGFKIHSRPDCKEPVWERPTGKYWTHTQALAEIGRSD
jgi:hypothetical protein